MKIKNNEKKQLGATDIFFPIPAALIVCGTTQKPNIITIAWIGIAGSDPPILSISVKKSRFSLDLIRDLGEFTVNIPSTEYFKETDYCGIVSGKNTDKFRDTGLTPLKSKKINVPIIKERPYNLECIKVKEVEFGEYVVIFGEIVETHIDSDKINDINNEIDIEKVNPLVYCARIREYWELGKKIGKGFESGKEIVKNQEKVENK
jgi:flavin reductase (DIM6/NTAB) family NADH-FMN oxidoreductase RutF